MSDPFASPGPPARVVYADADPNGLATILGGLIEGNLAADPARSALLARPAAFGLVAEDAEVEVTLRLAPWMVTVANGLVGRHDVVVRASSGALVGLSSVPLRFGLPDPATPLGRAVLGSLARREVRVQGLLTAPGKLARLNRLLSVM